MLHIDAPVEGDSRNQQPARSVPWNIIWAVAAFVIGIIFSAGMGWGRNSNSIDNMALSISRLEGAVSTLRDSYTSTDKAVAVELEKIEQHLSYLDGRMDRLESRK